MRRSWPIVLLVLAGCPSKESSSTSGAAAGSAAPIASATVVAPQTNLAPLDDTAATTTATATATPPRVKPATPLGSGSPTGASSAAGNTNAARIKQCCDGLRKSAATLAPASQEAQTVAQAAALCDGIASAVSGPATIGQAPEFAPVRQLMQGKTLPPVCQGL